MSRGILHQVIDFISRNLCLGVYLYLKSCVKWKTRSNIAVVATKIPAWAKIYLSLLILVRILDENTCYRLWDDITSERLRDSGSSKDLCIIQKGIVLLNLLTYYLHILKRKTLLWSPYDMCFLILVPQSLILSTESYNVLNNLNQILPWMCRPTEHS